MSRKKQKIPPFVMVRIDLLKDSKWRKLSSSAKVLYIYMRAKFNRETLSKVTLTYSEMKGVMSTRTMSKAFKELEKCKFIVKIKYGGLYGGACSYKFTGEYRGFRY